MLQWLWIGESHLGTLPYPLNYLRVEGHRVHVDIKLSIGFMYSTLCSISTLSATCDNQLSTFLTIVVGVVTYNDAVT